MKKYYKKISFLLILTLLISAFAPAVRANAERIDTGSSFVIEFDENRFVIIQDTAEIRVAEYYENGEKKQIATYEKKTGEILYNNLEKDLKNQKSRKQSYSLANQKTIRYHVDDFFVNGDEEKSEMRLLADVDGMTMARGANAFSFLKMKSFEYSGEKYYRTLYGYRDSRQYQQNSWHFKAGIAVSVVCLILNFSSNIIAKIVSAAGTVGGVLLSALTVQEWIKESFWVYKFKQTSPKLVEFICPDDFVYQTERRIELNGEEGYWEIIDKQEDWEIQSIRDDILTNPEYYI